MRLLELPAGLLVPEQDEYATLPGRYSPTIHEVRDIVLAMAVEIDRSPVELNEAVVVSRGGFTPMDPMTRTLDIRNNQTLSIEWYMPNPHYGEPGEPPEIPMEEPIVHQLPDFGDNIDGQGVLFVEDLTDKGHTGRWIRKMWPKSIMAVVYAKKTEEEILDYVDFYGLCVGDVWIDNPWEVEQRLRYSPIRVMDSIRWARNGRPMLQREMKKRRRLLFRQEFLDRVAA